jgi:O-antigen ligase
VGGLLCFIFVFRAKLGFARIAQILVVSTMVLAGAATVVSQQTEYSQMFDRLASTTEMKDGVPRTRAVVWSVAFENIPERPLLGHGPRVLQQHELRYRRVPPEQLVGPYPHNLYLHLLVTVGIVGLAAFLWFFFNVGRHIYLGLKHGRFANDYDRGLVVMGLLFLLTFLVDELKIEFNRDGTSDYVQFIFALCGIFVGWADKARMAVRELTAQPKRHVPSTQRLRDPVNAAASRISMVNEGPGVSGPSKTRS